MANREQSPARRFDRVWEKVSFRGVGLVATTNVEGGANLNVTIRTKEEPYQVGGLRPRVRTIEAIVGGSTIISLTDARAAFSPESEYVQGVIGALENLLQK